EEALTPQKVETVRSAWVAVAAYVPQPAFHQQAVQYARLWAGQLEELDSANKQIADAEARLAAKPTPTGVILAAIHQQRAEAYNTLQRFDDAFKAAEACAAASGKEGRHAPAAIKMQLDIALRKHDGANIEALGKKVLADYAESFEAGAAMGTLI